MSEAERGIPVSFLHELLTLDESSGRLFWKVRGLKFFRDGAQTAKHNQAIWNAKNAGKEAFKRIAKNGYKVGSIFDIRLYAHRVIYAMHSGAWPSHTIDHISGIKVDNRPINLRDVPHRENMLNMKLSKASSTGATGVAFDGSRGKYAAHVTVEGRTVHLGRFERLEDATLASQDARSSFGFHENHGRKR